MRSLLFLALVVPMFGAVDGSITNATNGKPAAGIAIALVQPSQQGMKTLAKSTSDASGKFAFDESPQGPGLLQATYEGVTYNKILMPGTPKTGVQVEIYDVTKKPVAKVAQHMILVQPTGTEISINETFLFQGDPKLTYSDHENGTLRLYIPPGVKGEINVQATAPGGMPVQRPAQATKQPDVYMVDYPIKPGETRLDLTYTLPEPNPPVLSGRILHKDGKTRLVAPNGVTLKGDNLTDLGKEPQSQASIYEVNGASYKVEIAGIGSLKAAEPASDEDTGQPQIEQSPPHIYNQIYWILGVTFAILGLGTYLLARR